MDQVEFFFCAPKKMDQKKVAPSPKKFVFIPATLENGLESSLVKDNAMLWLRSLTKAHRNNPEIFMAHQNNEILFKQSSVDPLSVVRDSLVLAHSILKK